VKVFVFDLLPYGENLEHLKQGATELPWPLGRSHFKPDVAVRTYAEHLDAWAELDKLGYDGVGWRPDPLDAARVYWLDAFTANIDRTWRNPNLLVWHGGIWLIDHGAALYFHHNWPTADPKRPFDASDHVLRDRATALAEAHAALAPQITERVLREVTALVPPEWFGDRGAEAYVEHLLQRAPIVPEVIRR